MKLKQSYRTTFAYAICTGITLALVLWFARELNALVPYFGITVLIISIVVLVVGLSYFFTRWYFSQILAPTADQNVRTLASIAHEFSDGEGEIDWHEKRQAVSAIVQIAERLAPTAWFIFVAGTLMGAIVAIVGLVNAAVIYQQTKTLEAQTTRLEEQTTVMSAQFLNEVASGLLNTNTAMAEIRTARRMIDDLRFRPSWLKFYIENVTGIEETKDWEFVVCSTGEFDCVSGDLLTLSELTLNEDMELKDLDFSGYRNLTLILEGVFSEMRITLPYILETNPRLLATSDGQASAEFDPETAVSEFYKLAERSIAICSLDEEPQFRALLDDLGEVAWALASLSDVGLIVVEQDPPASFADVDRRDAAATLSEVNRELVRQSQRMGATTDEAIGLEEIAKLISDRLINFQATLDAFDASCEREFEEMRKIRDTLESERALGLSNVNEARTE